MAHERPRSSNEMAGERTDLAVERTVMGADRSLMAWVRTGLSLISFGFTIYKFLEYEREQLVAETGKVLTTISSPKVIGLFMIGFGILSLVLGTVENVMMIRRLRGRFDITHARFSLFIAGAIAVLGLVLFIGILLNFKGIG
jgi:putative membrane protein